MNTEKITQEKEGILTVAVLLATSGSALINQNLYAGLACLVASVGLFYVRYKFKVNGRWKY